MASTTRNLSTWLEFYADLMKSNPGLARWAEASYEDLTKVTKGHLDKPDKFITTMATCSPFGAIVVHGTEGNVTILHHGTLYSRGLGMDPVVVFVSGNRSSSPFKTLDIGETVLPVGSGNLGTRARPIDTPSLKSFLQAKSADDFHGLKTTKDKENIFKEHPNHFMIGNDILQLVAGTGTAPAKDLAWLIIQHLNQKDGDDDDEDEDDEDDDDQKSILHYLWIVSNKKCRTSNIRDIPDDDDGIDQHCQRIRAKLANPLAPSPRTEAGNVNIGFDPTFIATQTALLTTANSINARLLAQTERETSGKSVLKGMAPKDKDLFTRLCTRDLKSEPAKMSSFMTSVLVEKSPSRITTHLRAVTREWEGSYFEGPFSRFLAKGYISHNEALTPGGFTLFMFAPKDCFPAYDGAQENYETLRVLWEQDLEETTLRRLAKDEFFLPRTTQHLVVQLDTATKMLETLTVPDGVAVDGLKKALKFLKRNSPAISQQLTTDSKLAIKIVYLLDRELQRFFRILGDADADMSLMDEDDECYLNDTVKTWLPHIETGRIPTVILPKILGGESPDTQTRRPPQNDRNSSTQRIDDLVPVTNPTVKPDWGLPTGRRYHEFFIARTESVRNWPIVENGKRMCVRYQATGKCNTSCRLSHKHNTRFSSAQCTEITNRFRRIYGL